MRIKHRLHHTNPHQHLAPQRRSPSQMSTSTHAGPCRMRCCNVVSLLAAQHQLSRAGQKHLPICVRNAGATSVPIIGTQVQNGWNIRTVSDTWSTFGIAACQLATKSFQPLYNDSIELPHHWRPSNSDDIRHAPLWDMIGFSVIYAIETCRWHPWCQATVSNANLLGIAYAKA